MKNSKMIPSVITLLLLATAHHSSGFSLQNYLSLIGNYNKLRDPNPDSWTGRWFPDKPTPAPSHEPSNVYSENSMSPSRMGSEDDSWSGRWFPDKPSILDHPAVYSSSSREKMDDYSSKLDNPIFLKNPEVDYSSSRENSDDGSWSPQSSPQEHHAVDISSSWEDTDDHPWKGRWFPDKSRSLESLGLDSSSSGSSQDYLVDDWKSELNHMGRMSDHLREMNAMDNSFCDDGKQNLTLDFPPDESHFVCHSGDRYIQPQFELPPVLTKYPIPTAFMPSHRCMNVSIEYPYSPPTFGNHRPNWAKWGEYEYLPPQRWIHNLEHGGVVMLYNPCAHHFLVSQLREIVRKCLYKHIITPYRLSSDRPLALVAWGWSLTMSELDEEEAKKFIEDHANRGPEMIDDDGKYDLYLKYPASKFSELGQGICSNI